MITFLLPSKASITESLGTPTTAVESPEKKNAHNRCIEFLQYSHINLLRQLTYLFERLASFNVHTFLT